VIDHKQEAVRAGLLGGLSIGVGSRTTVQNEWRLRLAAALIKLLALAPNHRLHREQINQSNLDPTNRPASPVIPGCAEIHCSNRSACTTTSDQPDYLSTACSALGTSELGAETSKDSHDVCAVR
jgi:hypothetical protein